jgi:hypothetical protein
VYPSLGVLVIDPYKLNRDVGFNTVTGSNVRGDNAYKLHTAISGAAALGYKMKARNVEYKTTNHYFIRIGAATSNYSNNPTFVLDNYIGDPRQQYSTTYPDLIEQRNIYFAPFTGSYMDYNGFIRLIQFFDNALFKMMEDFIPARTSLSTGITIDSPVLERNKISYAQPIFANQEVYTAEDQSSSISAQYGTLYNNLPGDKAAYYNGELSGSQIDIYNSYFIPANFNPYLGDTSSYNSQNTIEDSLSLNRFNHSEYNVLLNNVTSSLISDYRKLYEPIYGTTSSILSPVQLQDSYLSLKSYQTSRHEGSKLISLKYNTYTSSSYTSSDDFTSIGIICPFLFWMIKSTLAFPSDSQ